MISYEEMDIGPYRYLFTINSNDIINIDVSKTDYYMGDPTSYYDIMTTDKSRVYNPDGITLVGRIFKKTIVVPHNVSTDEEIMDINNDVAIAYPTGMILYADKYDFDEESFEYLCMLLYDYATVRGYTNQYTKYIRDKHYPSKQLNWN